MYEKFTVFMELSLSQYDMHVMPQKATKGQTIADFLAENPRSNTVALFEDLPDETAEVHSAKSTTIYRFGRCTLMEHLEPFSA